MAIFQKTVLAKYLKLQDFDKVDKAFKKYSKYFHNAERQQNIRDSKEEQFQEGFLRELFVNVLDYTLNPEPNFNLTTELKNEKNAKKTDGAIIKDGQALAVIELKSTKTKDLETIRQQAFDYKANQTGCVYVLTSNFEKIRFYINDAVEFEEFNLFTLTKEHFELMYLCLQKDNLLNNIPLKIKTESLVVEEAITKKFYADYSLFKRELFRDLVKENMKNEVFRSELQKDDTDRAKKNIKLTLFKKSQKLIDRFLFIFFAEDRGLLPPNSTLQILLDWDKLKELDEEVPLYKRFKLYFKYLDEGRKGTDKKAEIFAYNGGLFQPDSILDSLILDDNLLYKHTKALSDYDFQSQVDVNILGHIFENSLNEIENINAEIEGADFDKQKSKRKKDGVFYTPKYITKYIVDNTVGKLCTEKKAELEIIDEDFTPNRQKETKKKLLATLATYREWLLQLTICDPACGSGAFLNQALDFLIKEHNHLDELQTALLGGGIVFPNIENTILEKNIFGVDLNEESVEIAKLSLWLRTAQPRRKLNVLSSNIKCGNSLIDDKKFAGSKAFSWQQEFPDVFAKGGFDIVIGNPPYVFARDNISQELKNYYTKNYVSAEYQVNTYLLFIEQTIKIIRNTANFGLIIPNAWLMVSSATGLRNFILQNCSVNEIINLAGYSFEGVNVETIIILATKTKHKIEDNSIKVLLSDDKEFKFSHERKQLDFQNNEGFEFKVFSDEISVELTKKLKTKSTNLDDLVYIKAGLQAYEKDKGEPKQTAEDVKNRPYDYTYKFDQNTYKYLEGKDVGRYYINWSGQYLQYGKQLAAPRTFNLFDGEKIIIREITGKFPNSIIATYSDDLYLYNRSNIAIVSREEIHISLKYIIALLNSQLMAYYFVKNTAKSVRKMFPKIILNDLRKFPFKEISLTEQQPFIEKAEIILQLNKDIQKVSSKFIGLLQSELTLEKLSAKIENWHTLEWVDFEKELKKLKITLSGVQKEDWFERFNRLKAEAQTLKAEIDKTDKEIDQMVYELYDLTEDEIEIVENATN
ncbi:MAG: N-6 DNA methylase [Salinivirgaceae bacterium]|jgi:type I restriction-modification system DNA methylase subunit|nr:N-6 DNA methylase [Salinivirgaceae bacterium]